MRFIIELEGVKSVRAECRVIYGGEFGTACGFITAYPEGEVESCMVLYRTGEMVFNRRGRKNPQNEFLCDFDEPRTWRVPIAPEIKVVDYEGYGIALSYEHGCFFIGDWYKGLFCCDLQDGHVRWQYRLKHARETHIFKDYVVCVFQEIGLRKLSFAGEELAKYPMTTYRACRRLSMGSPYLFVGPRRQDYYILDTETMKEIRTIPRKMLAPSGLKEDPDVGIGEEEPFMAGGLIILDATGEPDRFEIRGFEGPVKFKRTIQL